MTGPVTLALSRASLNRLHGEAVRARARVLLADAEAQLALAAYYAALGAHDAAGDATVRSAEYEREAKLQRQMANDIDAGREAA